jgi:hypothetical protein
MPPPWMSLPYPLAFPLFLDATFPNVDASSPVQATTPSRMNKLRLRHNNNRPLLNLVAFRSADIIPSPSYRRSQPQLNLP